MRVTFFVIFYLLYPELLRKSFSLLNCIELDSETGLKTLSSSPNLEFLNEKHTIWVLVLSLPRLIFWGIMMPCFILIGLFYYKKYKIIVLDSNDKSNQLSKSGDLNISSVKTKQDDGKIEYSNDGEEDEDGHIYSN